VLSPAARVRLRALAALAFVVACNAALVGWAWWFRQSVAPGWVKGPLIDPASPYAPENAMVRFAVAACAAFDLYLLGSWLLWRRGAPLRNASPARRRIARLAPLGVALGAAWLTENGLRLWLVHDMVTYFRPHPTLHWVVRPNLRDFGNLKGGGRVTTNADGLRDGPASRARPPGTYRVMVLGDSSNFGHGVEGPEAWARVLERFVPTHRGMRVEVINGATPGWTTYQARAFMRGVGGDYAPDLIVAGFNNDPGPEYLGDAERAPGRAVAALDAWLFRSEFYLLGREVVLATVRRMAGTAAIRQAGEEPRYGALAADTARRLRPRVSREAFLANLAALDDLPGDFAWVNMPINRAVPELVARYVDPDYRAAAAELAHARGFPLIDVDAAWQRDGDADFQRGHVFHPDAAGHARIAAQVAATLFPGEAAPTPLTFGISSLTPVHAHVAAALAAHPELAREAGFGLDVRAYGSGKDQGTDVAAGRLDAFFSCEVPAARMLASLPDSEVVGTPGVLGRIAVVGRAPALAALRGRRVAVAPGSTPAMDWEAWGASLGAVVVPMDTDALQGALARGEVDAAVGWDPWVARWLADDPRLRVLASRPFRSVLAVRKGWAEAADPRGARRGRLVALVEAALRRAAAERPSLDAAVASNAGWPLPVVRAVADQNAWLTGAGASLALEAPDRAGLARAYAWSRLPLPAWLTVPGEPR
jgi:ABC-type nitrate/sulfonate/bicarbonate transport system substrate-binding protein